jgi:hypothetical protein
VVVPVDQRLVAHVDGDDDVVVLVRQLDAAADLGSRSLRIALAARVSSGIGSFSQGQPSWLLISASSQIPRSTLMRQAVHAG